YPMAVEGVCDILSGLGLTSYLRSLRQILGFAVLLTAAWVICCLLLARTFPEPRTHDESSYLLGADTFAHGRLASPAHPLARFFASPHILVEPVYAPKYPPGQALFLGLGQRLFGSPYYGVVIECAFMIFTLAVALEVWAKPVFARVIAVVIAACTLPPMYWSYSYWGGAAAASGGALILIAIGYARRNPVAIQGFVFSLGAVLLFYTRPFEGAVFVVGALLLFSSDLRRNFRWRMLWAAIPMAAIGLGFTAYYNKSITGSATMLPYVMFDQKHNVTPPFWFLPLRPEPVYAHPRLASQHGSQGWEEREYSQHKPWYMGLKIGFFNSFRALLVVVGLRLHRVDFAILAVLALLGWRDRTLRRMGALVVLSLVVMTFESWHFTHYAAPVLAALAAFIAMWADHLWMFRPRGIPLGPVYRDSAADDPVLESLPSRISLCVHMDQQAGIVDSGSCGARPAATCDCAISDAGYDSRAGVGLQRCGDRRAARDFRT
ncbi:MAG: hypothetical protein WDO18_19400, partial [Acidobacteriota bacterium]